MHSTLHRPGLYFANTGVAGAPLLQSTHTKVGFAMGKTRASALLNARVARECNPETVLQGQTLARTKSHSVATLYETHIDQGVEPSKFFQAIQEQRKRHLAKPKKDKICPQLFFKENGDKYAPTTINNAVKRLMLESKCAINGESALPGHMRHSITTLDSYHNKHRKLQFYRARHSQKTLESTHKLLPHPDMTELISKPGFQEPPAKRTSNGYAMTTI